MPQEHQDNPQGGHSQQLPGEQKYKEKIMQWEKVKKKHSNAGCAKEGVQDALLQWLWEASLSEVSDGVQKQVRIWEYWPQIGLKTDYNSFNSNSILLSGADLRRGVRPATKNIAQNQR